MQTQVRVKHMGIQGLQGLQGLHGAWAASRCTCCAYSAMVSLPAASPMRRSTAGSLAAACCLSVAVTSAADTPAVRAWLAY
eukprot:scaffold43127_cov62-Phaeocystis_antarctica.AAC.6